MKSNKPNPMPPQVDNSSLKDSSGMRKFASAKHTIPSGIFLLFTQKVGQNAVLPQVNRPPSTANSKALDSPSKTFSFNVQVFFLSRFAKPGFIGTSCIFRE